MTPVPDPSEVGEPDVAKNTPEDVGAEQRERIPGLFFAERHRGPVPHPIILEGYDALVPGTAKKMIENAIRRAELRPRMNGKRPISGESWKSRLV